MVLWYSGLDEDSIGLEGRRRTDKNTTSQSRTRSEGESYDLAPRAESGSPRDMVRLW